MAVVDTRMGLRRTRKGARRVRFEDTLPASGAAVPNPPVPPTPPSKFQFGVSIAGADLTFPAWPTFAEMQYVRNRITKHQRITIGWAHANEYQGPQGIQFTPFGALNTDYLAALKTVLDNATALGIDVMLDLHNFGQGPGLSGNITVTSITSVGTLATLTYSAVSGAPLVNGATVDIEGIGPLPTPRGISPYNGVFTIFNVTPTTFQYTMTSDPGVSPAGPVLNPGPISAIVAAEVADVGSARCPISAHTDLWLKISAWVRANIATGTVVKYEPMNEWSRPILTAPFDAAQALLIALRAAGDNTKLVFDGNHFSSAWDFLDNNNDILRTLVDPANNFSICPHGYDDYDGSGRFMGYAFNIAKTGEAPAGLQTNPMIAVQRAERQYAPWALANGMATDWGEFAWSDDNLVAGGNDNYLAWNAIGDNWMAYVQAKGWDVWWWGNGTEFGPFYGFNLSPSSVANAGVQDYSGFGVQPPQQVIIDKYIGYTGPQPVGYRVEPPTTVTRETLTIGIASDPYKVRYGGLIPADIHITPFANYADGRGNAGGAGGVTLPAGENALQSFTYTPTNPGKQVLGATNDGALHDVAPSVTLYSREAPAPASAVTLPIVGFNLEGMEEANGLCIPAGVGSPLPGAYRKTDANYFFYRGFNLARVCFSRSHTQQRLNGPIDTANTLNFTLTIYDATGNPVSTTYSGLQALDASISDITQSGLTCLLDLHDFGNSLVTVDISAVSVSGTTATCTMTDTSILNAGVSITLGANGVTPPNNAGLPTGAVTIVNSTTFTMPVPGGTPSSGATTGRTYVALGTAAYPISAFADYWAKIAARYAGNPKVMLGLMNEPASITAATMGTAAQAAITAIRAVSFTGYITVCGGGSFANAGAFVSSGALAAFLALTDPLNKLIAEVHAYVDSSGAGSSPNPGAAGSGARSLVSCTDNARVNGIKMLLGEYGMSTVAGLITEAGAQIDHISANTDVWVGWAMWGESPYSIRPPEENTPPFQYPPPGGTVTDQAMMPALMNHSFSSFYSAPPTGINMNWVAGFDGGFVPAATSIGTVLTTSLKAIIANIDGQGASTFALTSNPGGIFSINGSGQLVLAAALTDHTTYPISIQVTTGKGLIATFTESVICESVTTFDPTQKGTQLTLSGGNLIVTQSLGSNSYGGVRLTKPRTGGTPVYFEFLPTGAGTLYLSRSWDNVSSPAGFDGSAGLINAQANSTGSAFAQSTFFGSYPTWPSGTSRVRVKWDPANKTFAIAIGAGSFSSPVSYATVNGFVAGTDYWYIGYGIFNAGNSAQFFMDPATWSFALPAGCGPL